MMQKWGLHWWPSSLAMRVWLYKLRRMIMLHLLLPRAYIYTPTLNFLGLPRGVYIYARVEKSLYNRLFIGRYNLWLIRLLVQLFPKRVVVVLYIGFQFGTFYSQEYSLGYQNTDPKVEVWHPVAYHYSPMGGHMGQLSRITSLQATVRLLGYLQAKLRFI